MAKRAGLPRYNPALYSPSTMANNSTVKPNATTNTNATIINSTVVQNSQASNGTSDSASLANQKNSASTNTQTLFYAFGSALCLFATLFVVAY